MLEKLSLETDGQGSNLLPTNCVILNKLLNFSVPQFLHLENIDNHGSYFIASFFVNSFVLTVNIC